MGANFFHRAVVAIAHGFPLGEDAAPDGWFLIAPEFMRHRVRNCGTEGLELAGVIGNLRVMNEAQIIVFLLRENILHFSNDSFLESCASR
jgi:hypothetical protein